MLRLEQLPATSPRTRRKSSAAPAMGEFLHRFLLLLIVSSHLVTDSVAARTAPRLGTRSLFEIELIATVKITKISQTDIYTARSVEFDESCEDFFVENPTDCPKARNVQPKVAHNKNLLQLSR